MHGQAKARLGLVVGIAQHLLARCLVGSYALTGHGSGLGCSNPSLFLQCVWSWLVLVKARHGMARGARAAQHHSYSPAWFVQCISSGLVGRGRSVDVVRAVRVVGAGLQAVRVGGLGVVTSMPEWYVVQVVWWLVSAHGSLAPGQAARFVLLALTCSASRSCMVYAVMARLGVIVDLALFLGSSCVVDGEGRAPRLVMVCVYRYWVSIRSAPAWAWWARTGAGLPWCTTASSLTGWGGLG
jgi:hypothetical protein